MKIYKTKVIAKGLTGEQVQNLRRLDSGLGFVPDGFTSIIDHKRCNYRRNYTRIDVWPRYQPVNTYCLTRRVEFSHEHEISGKALLRLLPAWAKHHPIKSIGAKVTAFYAWNNKVVTRMHECGYPVGSEQYHEWAETQPDPFRATRKYLESKYRGAYA